MGEKGGKKRKREDSDIGELSAVIATIPGVADIGLSSACAAESAAVDVDGLPASSLCISLRLFDAQCAAVLLWPGMGVEQAVGTGSNDSGSNMPLYDQIHSLVSLFSVAGESIPHHAQTQPAADHLRTLCGAQLAAQSLAIEARPESTEGETSASAPASSAAARGRTKRTKVDVASES